MTSWSNVMEVSRIIPAPQGTVTLYLLPETPGITPPGHVFGSLHRFQPETHKFPCCLNTPMKTNTIHLILSSKMLQTESQRNE